jgi:hypothetical protein
MPTTLQDPHLRRAHIEPCALTGGGDHDDHEEEEEEEEEERTRPENYSAWVSGSL